MTRIIGWPHALRTSAAIVLTALLIASCGGDDTTEPSNDTQLLSVNVVLPAGQNCEEGGSLASFTGTAGKTVTILAVGASTLRPAFFLYAPDFTTLLGASAAYGNGKARLSFTLTESGVHNLSVCETDGKAGSVTLTVVTPTL